MKPAPFQYVRVRTADEAIDRLSALGEDARLLAGGQSLVPLMNLRLVRPTALVDISRVEDLRYVRRDGETLRIGALTPHHWLYLDEDGILADHPIFQRAAQLIGSHPVRVRGTFGGSLAHADPVAEWCVLAALFDATITVRGPEGQRDVAACDFFTAPFESVISPLEMVTETAFATLPARTALRKLSRRAGSPAVVIAGADLHMDDGRCVGARIAAGASGGSLVRAHEAEALLAGAEPNDELLAEVSRAVVSALGAAPRAQHGGPLPRALAQGVVREAIDDAIGAPG